MKTWEPWTITNNTLQLTEWSGHEPGVVVVEGDVFAAQEVAVVDLEGDIVCHTLPPGVGSHDTDPWGYDDVLSDLFAHIDAHPATHYVLRTLHPERVREVWCHGGIPYLGPMDRSPEETATEWANRLVRTQLRRPNVTLSLGPLATQADADRLVDLCGTVELSTGNAGGGELMETPSLWPIVFCFWPLVVGIMMHLARISSVMQTISENISLIRYELEHWHDTDTEDES